MTPDLAISLATAARWTVTGTSERKGVTTLYLKTPLGRAFQLTLWPGWDEATVVEKLKVMATCPLF